MMLRMMRLLLLYLFTAVAVPAQPQQTFDFSSLDSVVRDELQQMRTPGAAVAVVLGDRIIYAKGYGLANVETEEPVRPEMRLGVSGILCKEQFRVFASYISFRFCLGARLARPQTPAADYFFAPARWWFVEKLVRVPSSLLSCSRGNGNALGSTDFASGRCPSGGEPFQG